MYSNEYLLSYSQSYNSLFNMQTLWYHDWLFLLFAVSQFWVLCFSSLNTDIFETRLDIKKWSMAFMNACFSYTFIQENKNFHFMSILIKKYLSFLYLFKLCCSICFWRQLNDNHLYNKWSKNYSKWSVKQNFFQ